MGGAPGKSLALPLQILRQMRYLLLAAALLTLPTSLAHAGEPTQHLKERVDEIVRMVDPSGKTRPGQHRGDVRRIAETIFDYPETARRALGPHWTQRTPAEQKEFVGVFADLLDRAYLSKVDQYQGEKIRYTNETMEGDQATVKTMIVMPRGSEVPVDYRMHQVNGRWLVYDVIIEGVSLVSNYRQQFNKIIQTESYPALIAKMRSKQAEPAASGR